MKNFYKIIFISIILIGLISSVSAYPPIPAEFYGVITINGAPAPVGTSITALIDGTEGGTITTSSVGVYGGSGNFQNRLIVQGKETDPGKTIVFRINSVATSETAIFTPGFSQQRDLSIVTGSSSGTNASAPIKNTNDLQMDGLQFTNASQGTASQAIINIPDLESAGSHMTVSGSTVTITSDTYSLKMPAAGSIDENEQNGTLSFTPQSIQLNTKPVSENINSIGEVSATIQANLNNIPSNAQITTTITQQPTSAVSSSFQLAATTNNLKIDDVAYTLNVERQNIQDATNIANATIQMSISPEWVISHGGIASIKLIRTGEDGTSQVLDTTFAGFDSAGRMVFEGFSPKGLSTFGLVSTTNTAGSPSSAGSSSGFSSGGSGSGSSSYTSVSTNPGQPQTFIGTGTLNILQSRNPSESILSSLITILSKDSIAAIILNKGITVKDRSGNPIPEISISPLSASDISLPSGSGIEFVGYAYDFGPDGAVFSPQATLVFSIPQEKWNTLNLEQLSVRQYNPSSKTWDPIDTRVNSATKSVTASVTHFTKIGLFQTGSSQSNSGQSTVAAVSNGGSVKGNTGGSNSGAGIISGLFNPLVITICAVMVIVIGAAAVYRHKRRTVDPLTLEPFYSSQPLIDQDKQLVQKRLAATITKPDLSQYTGTQASDVQMIPTDSVGINAEIAHLREMLQQKDETIDELKKERDWLRQQVTNLHVILAGDKKE